MDLGSWSKLRGDDITGARCTLNPGVLAAIRCPDPSPAERVRRPACGDIADRPLRAPEAGSHARPQARRSADGPSRIRRVEPANDGGFSHSQSVNPMCRGNWSIVFARRRGPSSTSTPLN